MYIANSLRASKTFHVFFFIVFSVVVTVQHYSGMEVTN